MAFPLLSIVIPTHKRPTHLPHAIESALQSSPDGDVEVIVVPNGNDETWRSIAKQYKTNTRVQWHPIQLPHANTARNHGLSKSNGKYIRFLDDDDYLLPSSSQQLQYLEREAAEICSGRVLNVDINGSEIGLTSFPQTDDFIVACTSISGFTLPVSNVYLRASLGNCRWDERVNRAQDNVWMLDLACTREWRWCHMEQPVGAWVQHPAARVSTTRISTDRPSLVIDTLEKLWASLKKGGRLTPARQAAIAAALWHYVHWRFPFQPLYWHRVAKIALHICPESRPDHPLFEHKLLARVPALTVEWAIYPARRTMTLYRDIQQDLIGRDYRRQL